MLRNTLHAVLVVLLVGSGSAIATAGSTQMAQNEQSTQIAQSNLTEPEARAAAELRRDLERKERELALFERLIVDLAVTVDESSRSVRKQTIEAIETAMGEAIVADEERVREMYLIVRHDEPVEQVRTDDVAGSSITPSSRQKALKSFREEDRPSPEYYRLANKQAIYRSCATIQEHAVARQGDALAKYISLVDDFAETMRQEVATLRAVIPPEDDPLADEPEPADAGEPDDTEETG